MKILFTNHHLADFAGTETFTWTVAHALRRAGHEVVIATAQKGAATRIFENEGFDVFEEFDELKNMGFDVIHAQHNPMAVLARHAFPATPMVFMGHGVFHPLEQPPSADLAVAEWVAVSEEIRDYWAERYGLHKVQIFRNPIDCRRYRQLRPICEELQRILVISNNYPVNLRAMVERTCSDLGISVRFVGGMYNAEWEIERLINEVDLVISIGRGVLEAMACGRAVLVLDQHGCDGLMTPELYRESRKFNFSGRRFARKLRQVDLAELFAAYDSGMGGVNRALIEEHHNVDQEVSNLEQIYQRAVRSTRRFEPICLPVNEIAGCINRWRSSLKNTRLLLEYEKDKTKRMTQLSKPNEFERAYRLLVNELFEQLEPETLLTKTGLKTIPLDLLLADMRVSSAAIISSGPSVLRRVLRDSVESCDVVCRINRFSGIELEHATGSHCDLWVTNGYALANVDIREHLSRTPRILFAGDIRPALKAYNLVTLRRLFGDRLCSFLPIGDYEDMIVRLGGYPPTNGFVAFSVLLEVGVRRFLILGADYFFDLQHNSFSEKDVPEEVWLVAKACRSSGCVIECTPPLYDLLRIAGVPQEQLYRV